LQPAKRLPFIVLTGPTDSLKFELARTIRSADDTRRFLVLTDVLGVLGVSDLSDHQANYQAQSDSENSLRIAGCLCCTGAVTLLTKVIQLLRAERRQKNYDAVLVVAGPSTEGAKLLDHLRQALLAELIEVQNVIYISSTSPKIEQSAEITVADFVVTPDQPHTDEEMQWVHELPGHQERVFRSTLDFSAHFTALVNAPNHSTLRYRVWPPTKVFNRQAITTLTEKYVAQGLAFDAVFRTERAWYRWQLKATHVHCEETTYRRQSYVSSCSSFELNSLFDELLLQIESVGN
jgi:hypothetical protein